MRISCSRGFLFSVMVGCLTLAACASTKLVNQWSNPAYTAPSFKKVMVIGVARQSSIRRSFEDEFVNQLKAAGVDTVPGYQYIQEEGQVGEERLRQAVAQARGRRRDHHAACEEGGENAGHAGFLPAPAGSGFYGWYSAGWVGYYEPPRVYQYDVYTSETSLYDTVKNQVVWTGTAETTAPGDIDKEIKNYAEIMISALREKKLI